MCVMRWPLGRPRVYSEDAMEAKGLTVFYCFSPDYPPATTTKLRKQINPSRGLTVKFNGSPALSSYSKLTCRGPTVNR